MDEEREQPRRDAGEDGVDRIARAWQRERPGTPVTSMGVVIRLRRIAKLLEDDHRRTVNASGIDPATRDLLSTLRRSGPPYRLSAGDLARSSLRSTGAISQRVARAEREGSVRRSRSGPDGRTVMVELTPQGHELIERGVDTLLRRELELLSGLTADEQAELSRLLRVLLADLSRRLDVQDWPPPGGG